MRQASSLIGPGLSWLLVGCATSSSLMAVNVPVGDLRARPRTVARSQDHDPLQETQVLYGERVRVVHVSDGWAEVRAIEQPEFTHHRRWEGYPGWLPESSLRPWHQLLAPTVVVSEPWAIAFQNAYLTSPAPWRFAMGTQLRATDIGGQLWKVELLDGATVWIPSRAARPLQMLAALSAPEQRQMILAGASRLIGAPYFWGGRSPGVGDERIEPRSGSTSDRADAPARMVTGLDCSGLVNLAYRAAGMTLPRDAHEQYLRAHPVSTLQPADLVFLSEQSNPRRIVHVMLYAGGGLLIEAPGTGHTVRRIRVAERFGRPLESLRSGDVVKDQTVVFGSYINAASQAALGR